MDDRTRQFLADAARIRLTADEKAHSRDDIAQFMTGESAIQELETDPAIRAFLKEAAGIALTMDETEVLKMDLTQFVDEHIVRSQVEERHSLHMDDRSGVLGDPDQVSLSKNERFHARRELVSFMEQKRAAVEVPPLPAERLTLAEYLQDFWRVILPRTAVLACAFLLLSTSAAFAAEGSVPGDWLYPLKVEVFEQVRGKFIFTSQEKAQWESTRAMRRLEETEWLAASDDLTQDNWLELHGNFVEHVVDAQRHIDELANRGDKSAADHLSADLDAYLRAHHTVLQAIGVGRHDNPEIEAALEHVQDTQENVIRRRQERTDTGGQKENADEDGENKERRTAAESALRSALSELNRVRRGGVVEKSQAGAKLKDAESLMEEANAQFDAGLYVEAEAIAREAVQAAAEAKLLRNLPQEWSLPAVKKKNDTTKEATEKKNNSSSSSDISSPASNASSSSVPDDKNTSSSDASVEQPEPQEGDDAAEIDVDLPGVEVKVNLDGLLR